MTWLCDFLHIHWYREVGMTSKSGQTWYGRKWNGWSTIHRCRCGKEILKEM